MNILFLGDSLIEFFDWQSRFPQHRVVNLGRAGESVQGLLSRIVKIKEAVSSARFIFIMSGINNIAMQDNEFFPFYRIILEKLQTEYPEAEIFITTLLPTLVDFISPDTIIQVNQSLTILSEEMHTNLLDIYNRFVDDAGKPIKEYLLDDGVHVSVHGYSVWSGMIEEIIGFKR